MWSIIRLFQWVLIKYICKHFDEGKGSDHECFMTAAPECGVPADMMEIHEGGHMGLNDRGENHPHAPSQCKEYCEYLKEECSLDILQARIQALGGNGEQPLQLDKDPVENRKSLLKRARMMTPLSSLEQIVHLTPQKMRKLRKYCYLKPKKWSLRQSIVKKIEDISSKGSSKVRQGSKIAPNKRRA